MKLLTGSLLVCLSRAFVPSILDHHGSVSCCYRNQRTSTTTQISSTTTQDDEEQAIGIVAPLTYIRGCPIVSLDFADSTLDFVLSTGSNVNTINPEIVKALEFGTEAPFQQVPVVACGMGQYFDGDSILLGDASLASIAAGTRPMKLKDMFAVALALEPAGHGQLGVPFFFRFNAVEFAWHGLADSYSPTLALYRIDIPLDQDPSLTRIPIERLPAQIALIETVINGNNNKRQQPLKAILATCSPVTILSPEAAKGIALSDDVFTVNALDGTRQVQLRRSIDPVQLSIIADDGSEDDDDDGTASLFNMGESYIYVGDLPGHDEFLAEANMVLGTDFLRNAFRMVLTEDFIYVEPMNGREPFYESS